MKKKTQFRALYGTIRSHLLIHLAQRRKNDLETSLRREHAVDQAVHAERYSLTKTSILMRWYSTRHRRLQLHNWAESRMSHENDLEMVAGNSSLLSLLHWWFVTALLRMWPFSSTVGSFHDSISHSKYLCWCRRGQNARCIPVDQPCHLKQAVSIEGTDRSNWAACRKFTNPLVPVWSTFKNRWVYFAKAIICYHRWLRTGRNFWISFRWGVIVYLSWTNWRNLML